MTIESNSETNYYFYFDNYHQVAGSLELITDKIESITKASYDMHIYRLGDDCALKVVFRYKPAEFNDLDKAFSEALSDAYDGWGMEVDIDDEGSDFEAGE